MRRSLCTGAILALASLVYWGTPVSAHPGAVVFEIGVGVVTPIEVLVPADYGKPIDAVTISTATGFRLDGGTPPPGWQLATDGTSLMFTGGLIPANTPGILFGLRGAATAKGRLIFPVTTHSPDGTVMHYTNGPGSRLAGVVVYAGAAPALPGRGTLPWKAVGGGVVATVGVLGTGFLFWRRRGRPALTSSR